MRPALPAGEGAALIRPAPRPERAPQRRTVQPQLRRRPRELGLTDYGYVLQDLRRIAVVAGSLVGLLVVLSFIIR